MDVSGFETFFVSIRIHQGAWSSEMDFGGWREGGRPALKSAQKNNIIAPSIKGN